MIMKRIVITSLLLLAFTCISAIAIGQNNQNIEAQKLSSGSFDVYKKKERGYNRYYFEKASKPWPVEIFIEDDKVSKILVKRVGIIEELYEADLPDYPAYYFGGNADINVSILDGKIYYYTYSVKSGADIAYILSSKKPGDYDDELVAIENYRKRIKDDQSGARTERKEEKAMLAAKEAEENSLNGKSIKSIEVKFVKQPDELGLLSVVGIGFEVTLKNGKTLKTKNLGGKTPYTDFEVMAQSGSYSGGDFKVANNSGDIIDDQIYLLVKSKYGNAPAKSFSHPLNYKSTVAYQYQGNSGSFGRGNTVGYSRHGKDGGDGKSITLDANYETVNGQQIIHYKILDNYGQLITTSKVHPNYKIKINLNGGNGGDGAEGKRSHDGNGGNGGNGGDGGDITITGTAKNHNGIIVTNRGGRGGNGGAAENVTNRSGSNGSRGVDGQIIR
jgi:hypothetical protein